MTNAPAENPPDTSDGDELWDHDSLVAQLTENNGHLNRAAAQARQSRIDFQKALESHDRAAIEVARFEYESDAAVFQEFVRSQERIMHRLEHLDAQRRIGAANTLAGAMVTWTKVLAGATVVLAVATVALIVATVLA